MSTDATRMRRVRRRYVARFVAWLEADREHIYELCDRMRSAGLYAATTAESDIRCGVLSTVARLSGHESPTLRKRWLMKTGWIAFWGWSGSRHKRSRVAASA